jgi:hypothetical protein
MSDDSTIREVALRDVAAKIRGQFLETAVNAYEDAAADGLCAQGAWECAVDAMRRVELTDLLAVLVQATPDQTSSRLPSGSRK